MALTNYSDLVASLATLAIRSDQAATWPTAIQLAEAQIQRALIGPDAQGKRQIIRPMMATATLTVGAEYVNLPPDMLKPLAIELQVTSSATTKLKAISPDTLVRMKEDKAAYQSYLQQLFSASPPPPGWYAVAGAQLRLFPAPTTPYSAILTYLQAIPPLQANSTNWLMTAHPDVYVYGALVQFGMMVQDERRADWTQAHLTALQGVKDFYPTEPIDAELRVDVGLQNTWRWRRSGFR